MSPSHVLAVDQGTTGTTVVVLDPDGAVAGRAAAEIAQHYPRPGWVEHDPEEVWRSVVDTAGAALADAGVGAADLAAIGITNQRETVVLWDRRTGEPVAPAVVWQDRRTAEVCADLASRGLGPFVRNRTGLVIDPYFSATKVAWLLDHLDLRGRAERGELAFGTVDSWLVHRMTGGALHVTDATNASRTMCFDIARLEWDDELLAELRVPRAVLPEVCPSMGELAMTSWLGADVAVMGVLGDQQASLFAQACHDPGQAKNTYGTGSFLLLNTGDAPLTGETSMLSTVALGLAADLGGGARYALEGPMFVTGSAVQWLRDELRIISDAAETEALARSIDDTGDVWFVPGLTGLGAPYWDPYARGSLVGMTRGTGRAEICRAVLESITHLTRDVVETMQRESGIRVGELRVDGGAVANSWLMQRQADILGIPVDVPAQIESTSLGSGLLAGVAAGVWPDLASVEQLRTTAARYEPQMGADQRESLVARWHQAVERSRGWAAPPGGVAAGGVAAGGAL